MRAIYINNNKIVVEFEIPLINRKKIFKQIWSGIKGVIHAMFHAPEMKRQVGPNQFEEVPRHEGWPPKFL